MPLIVDYTKAELHPLISDGGYPAHQLSAEVKPSKTSEHPNILIKYVLDADNPEPAGGMEFEKYYGTSPKAIEQLKKALCAMGHVDETVFEDPKQAAKLDFEAMALGGNGLPCQVIVGSEIPKDGPFQGEKRNRLQRVIPIGQSS